MSEVDETIAAMRAVLIRTPVADNANEIARLTCLLGDALHRCKVLEMEITSRNAANAALSRDLAELRRDR
jgi:hypothetical protein